MFLPIRARRTQQSRLVYREYIAMMFNATLNTISVWTGYRKHRLTIQQ